MTNTNDFFTKDSLGKEVFTKELASKKINDFYAFMMLFVAFENEENLNRFENAIHNTFTKRDASLIIENFNLMAGMGTK